MSGIHVKKNRPESKIETGIKNGSIEAWIDSERKARTPLTFLSVLEKIAYVS